MENRQLAKAGQRGIINARLVSATRKRPRFFFTPQSRNETFLEALPKPVRRDLWGWAPKPLRFNRHGDEDAPILRHEDCYAVANAAYLCQAVSKSIRRLVQLSIGEFAQTTVDCHPFAVPSCDPFETCRNGCSEGGVVVPFEFPLFEFRRPFRHALNAPLQHRP